jgi:hypothetical protein
MPRPRKASRLVLFVFAGIAVCGLLAVLVATAWIRSFLAGEQFRILVSDLTSARLGVEGEFLPLRWSGAGVHSEGFSGSGLPGRTVESIRADQLRAEFALRAILDGVWRVDNLQIERLRVALRPGGSSAAGSAAGGAGREIAASPAGSAWAGWLPRRFDLPGVQIQTLDALWGGGAAGSVTGLRASLRPDGSAWLIQGENGTLALSKLPTLEIARARARWQSPKLHLLEVALRDGPQGSLVIAGVVGPGSEFDVRADVAAVPLKRWLPETWQKRLSGDVFGDTRIRKLSATAPVTQEGKLRIEGAQLADLRVLDTIARFTRTERFRNPVFQRVAGNYTFNDGRLAVRAFEAESPGLIRIEGDFVVQQGNIDGTFQVGVTPASLRWLPGAEQRVFTVARGGYLWAPMALRGPLSAPREDLSARLAAAAPEAMLEEARGAVEGARGAAEGVLKDGVGGLLDMLLPAVK